MMLKLIVVMVALIAFGTTTLAVAADFYVIKDATGKSSVVDKKPADAKSIVKGPFKTKADAEKSMKAATGKGGKPPAEPMQGC
jgi:hypothetical protein